VTPILAGHLLTSDQGNPAFCSVLLVESDGRRALFDTGHAGRRRHLLKGLAARGVAADAVPTLRVLRDRRASGRPYDREQADASVERVAAVADVVYPGHDRAIRLGADGFDYAEAAVPLTFRVPL
jgi:glyoxylase-like metal-dependent hydrolase (beta-lactamase superfamily II)